MTQDKITVDTGAKIKALNNRKMLKFVIDSTKYIEYNKHRKQKTKEERKNEKNTS